MAWLTIDAATHEILDTTAERPADEEGRYFTATPLRYPDEIGWDPAVPGFMPIATLDAQRARRWAAVKAARDRAESWGCPSPLGRVDTDAVSRVKVAGAVQLAMIAAAAGEPFEIAWTMQSNAAAPHDGPAMIAMGVAVGRHVAACHAVALTKRAAIEAAGDEAAIAAVDVEGGWPDAPDA